MKNKRKQRKELRANIYRALTPQEKEVRRKHALGTFLTLVFVALLVFVTGALILAHAAKAPNEESVPDESAPTSEPYFTVVLDPGHGFGDEGTVVDGINEAERCFEIAQKAKLLLEEAGYRVRLSREDGAGEETDAERAKKCDSYAADALISIHLCPETGVSYSLITEKTLISGKMAKCFSSDVTAESESAFLASLRTPAIRLGIAWETDDDRAVEMIIKGIMDYAEYAHENGLV